MYATLGYSETSSDEDICREFKRLRKFFHRVAKKCHPDKMKDAELIAKYERHFSKFGRVEKAFTVLGEANESGCFALRVEYDKDGEWLRDKMKEVFIYLSVYFSLIRCF